MATRRDRPVPSPRAEDWARNGAIRARHSHARAWRASWETPRRSRSSPGRHVPGTIARWHEAVAAHRRHGSHSRVSLAARRARQPRPLCPACPASGMFPHHEATPIGMVALHDPRCPTPADPSPRPMTRCKRTGSSDAGLDASPKGMASPPLAPGAIQHGDPRSFVRPGLNSRSTTCPTCWKVWIIS